jgi:hypothetical protein
MQIMNYAARNEAVQKCNMIGDYTSSGMVLCIARQGIHIHRTEGQQARSIARRAFITTDMVPLTGNA